MCARPRALRSYLQRDVQIYTYTVQIYTYTASLQTPEQQIALFVIPFMVIWGWITNMPMDLMVSVRACVCVRVCAGGFARVDFRY